MRLQPQMCPRGPWLWRTRAARGPTYGVSRRVSEVLTGIKRAGANIIITYHAPDVLRWMDEGRW